MNALFNPTRFFRMVVLDLALSRRPLFIAAGCIMALTILVPINGDTTGATLFPAALFLTGLLLTAAAFNDLHDKATGAAWLLVPVSMVEKFLSRALLTSVGASIGVTLAVVCASCIASLRTNWNLTAVFSPFTPEHLRLIATYLVVQSIFLAGAALFKKHAFIKTLLAMGVLALVFTILLSWISQSGIMTMLPKQLSLGAGYQLNLQSGSPVLDGVGKFLWWVVLAPAMWAVSFWRVRSATA